MDVLAGFNVAQGGATAVLGLVVLLILVGRLVPRRTVDDMRADYQARIDQLTAERDTWRAAHQVSEEARHEEHQQNRDMLELARTSVHVLRSLPSTAGEVADAPLVEDAAASK